MERDEGSEISLHRYRELIGFRFLQSSLDHSLEIDL